MPSLKALKSLCGIFAAVLVLSGCGGGSGSGSASTASASSPSSSVSGSSTTGSTGTSGSTGTTGSSGSSGSGSSSSGSSSSGSSGSGSSTTQGSATLKWTAPTANNNGSALTNLAGYYIYYGTSPSSLTNVVNISSPSTVSYVVSNLGAGTWYFAIAAYTNAGVASPMSNVGSKTIS